MTTNLKRIILTAVIFLIGCGGGMESTAVSKPIAPPTAVSAATAPSTTSATATALATATAVPPSPTPIPPTPTPIPPKPIVSLYAPPAWEAVAAAAIAELNAAENGAWRWELTGANAADIQLQQQAVGGAMAHQRPLALAVPFTEPWTAVTQAEAETIVANGHALVTVLPWEEMPPTHKALRVDGVFPFEAGYRLQERWALTPADHPAITELMPLLRRMMAQPTVRLTAVGDIMLDRYLGEKISARGEIDYPFAKVLDAFSGADVLMGNLECSLGDVGEPAPKRYRFQAPPEAAQTLGNAGFDLVMLANNHALDFGQEALLQGIDLLEAEGVTPIGAGKDAAAAHAPYFMEIHGLTLAFLSYVQVPKESSTGFDVRVWTATDDAPGLAWGDPEGIEADVTAVRPQADVVVVNLHSGYEYIEEPSEEQAAAAKAAIDAGADLVIGHHAHILQGVEYYNGGVIVYGLGNFAFHIEGEPNTAVLNVWLTADGVRQLEIVPAIVQNGGAPRMATAEEAVPILNRVYWLTAILNAGTNWREIGERP